MPEPKARAAEPAAQTLGTVAQRQIEAEQSRADLAAKAEAERIEHDARIQDAARDAVGSEQERVRADALKEVEATRKAFEDNRAESRRLDRTAEEIAQDRLLNQLRAQALKIDETVPGGSYVVDGRLRDANGRDLGPAKAED